MRAATESSVRASPLAASFTAPVHVSHRQPAVARTRSTCAPVRPRVTGLDELEHGLHSSPDFLKLISSTGNKPLTAAALLEEMDTQACRAPPDAAPRRSAAHARVASG